MYDFNSLLEEILRNKPELTREEIMAMIQEKKETVGSGFLTDQGALFLIAGELGVQLRHMTSTDLTLKDLYVGANDITIVARVLAIYPISEYNKKEGGTGRYRKLILFDRDNQSKLTIWDDNPEAIKLEGISVDSPVRILNGYVRQGLDGKPNLNIGRKGRIEVLGDESLVSRLTPMSELWKSIGEIGELQSLVAVKGTTISGSRTSSFARKDGSSGSLTQFELRGDSEREKVRVVVWDAPGIEVGPNQSVLVTNLRVKKSLNGENELHGDRGSLVEVIGAPAKGMMTKGTKVNQVIEARRSYTLDVMVLSQLQVGEVQLKEGGFARKGELLVGDETGEIALTAWRNLVGKLEVASVGDRIRVSAAVAHPSKIGRMILELQETSRVEKTPV